MDLKSEMAHLASLREEQMVIFREHHHSNSPEATTTGSQQRKLSLPSAGRIIHSFRHFPVKLDEEIRELRRRRSLTPNKSENIRLVPEAFG